jgi:hypothetical protein
MTKSTKDEKFLNSLDVIVQDLVSKERIVYVMEEKPFSFSGSSGFEGINV